MKKIMAIGIIGMFLLISIITVSASNNTSVSTNDSPTCIPVWSYLTVCVHHSSGAVVPGAMVTVEQWHFLRHNYASGQTNSYGEVKLLVIVNIYTITKIHASFGNEYGDSPLFNRGIAGRFDIYIYSHPGTDSISPSSLIQHVERPPEYQSAPAILE